MNLTFTVPGIPVAQPRQRHRVINQGGRTFSANYTPANSPVNAFRAAVAVCAHKAYDGPPLSGPVTLEISFVFPRPKSGKKHAGRMPKASKPDWDNLGKSVSDALTGILWLDDAQIWRAVVTKEYSSPSEGASATITVRAVNDA